MISLSKIYRMNPPKTIELIGNTVCVVWNDAYISIFDPVYLRKHSPSACAEMKPNTFNSIHAHNSAEVSVIGWRWIGNYAVAFHFSDRHTSGIYSWDYLEQLSTERLYS